LLLIRIDRRQIVAATRRPKRRSNDSKKSSTKPKPNGLKSRRERRQDLMHIERLGRPLKGLRNLKVVGRSQAATQRLAGSEKATRSLEAELPVPRTGSPGTPSRP